MFTMSLPCQFPFFYNGVKYEECTNAKLPKEYFGSEEDLLWCATHLDDDRNMVLWGQCDLENSNICQNGGQIITSVTSGSLLLLVAAQIFLLN